MYQFILILVFTGFLFSANIGISSKDRKYINSNTIFYGGLSGSDDLFNISSDTLKMYLRSEGFLDSIVFSDSLGSYSTTTDIEALVSDSLGQANVIIPNNLNVQNDLYIGNLGLLKIFDDVGYMSFFSEHDFCFYNDMYAGGSFTAGTDIIANNSIFAKNATITNTVYADTVSINNKRGGYITDDPLFSGYQCFHAYEKHIFFAKNGIKIFPSDSGAVNIDSTGILLSGYARKYVHTSLFAYNIYSSADIYNSVDCDVAGTVILPNVDGENTILAKSFNDGQYLETHPEACLYSVQLGNNYAEGTDIIIEITWCAIATTGIVEFGVGVLAVGQNESTKTSLTYVVEADSTNITTLATNYIDITFDGSNMEKNDNIMVVIYRNADQGTDNMNGDAYIISSGVKYLEEK